MRRYWVQFLIALVVVHLVFVQAAKAGWFKVDSVGRITLSR